MSNTITFNKKYDFDKYGDHFDIIEFMDEHKISCSHDAGTENGQISIVYTVKMNEQYIKNATELKLRFL